jgi:hypothetical protein
MKNKKGFPSINRIAQVGQFKWNITQQHKDIWYIRAVVPNLWYAWVPLGVRQRPMGVLQKKMCIGGIVIFYEINEYFPLVRIFINPNIQYSEYLKFHYLENKRYKSNWNRIETLNIQQKTIQNSFYVFINKIFNFFVGSTHIIILRFHELFSFIFY